MDEIYHAFRGKVDDCRLQRRAAFVSGMFDKSVKETDLWGLPFDDELTESTEDLVAEYNRLRGG